MKPSTVLLLPGWKNSGPDHWQSRWEAVFDHVRVQQHDWGCPLRGDWLMQLEQAVLQGSAITLVAHGLGCQLVAAWAAHSRKVNRVSAALLVAPSDVEREEVRSLLPSWSPIARHKLPFPSIVVTSQNDPFCSFTRSQQFARDWGSELIDLGMMGHINAETGLADWPQGQALLERLQRLPSKKF